MVGTDVYCGYKIENAPETLKPNDEIEGIFIIENRGKKDLKLKKSYIEIKEIYLEKVITKNPETGEETKSYPERRKELNEIQIVKGEKIKSGEKKELEFKIVNLDEEPKEAYVLKHYEDSHWRKGFFFAKMYDDAECIVETCCLKTHRHGGHFTLSLKNAVGLVRRDYMPELHSSKYQREMIAEINTVFKPDLIIMDGLVTFVDGGPMNGTRKKANVFVAGTDRIAIDAVGVALLRILGTTPEVTKGSIFKQAQIKRAVELGVGITSQDEIEFITNSEEAEKLVAQIKEKLAE